MTTAQVAAIETADIAALKTSQVVALTTANVAALTTDQVVSLTTAQISSMTTKQIVALSTSQAVAIETTDIAALKTSQVAALATATVAALTTNQLVALTTSQIRAFSSAQAAALTTTQNEALTSTQIGAFSTAAIQGLTLGTPLVLDLNGDGVQTMSITAGVKFDLFDNGKNVNTGWVSSTDGLLVLDRNHDGVIKNGSELFGSATKLADGTNAADGYAALQELDANHDGVISDKDAAFADLKVWVDADSDGVTDDGELKSLSSLGITEIGAIGAVDLSKNNGNLVGLTSTYKTEDGNTHAAADVWFVADKNQEVDSAIANLANAPVVAVAAPLPSAAEQVPEVSGTPDLRTKVSGMAQALGNFSDAESYTGMKLPGKLGVGEIVATPTPVALAVGGMVDVMKQFDAHGNLLTSQGSAGLLGKSPGLQALQDPSKAGMLVSKG
ncbi:MAG: hypothetical protein H7Y28_03790 [Rhodoferax sp.]|nr:hypothetical protein [Rhodoferax sp.]